MPKIINSLPREAVEGDVIALDIEMFGQDVTKLHRPHGTFACLSMMYDGEDVVYQIYDTKQIPLVFELIDKAQWVLVNALYDLRQLRKWDYDAVLTKERPIWDCMLVEQNLFGGYYRDFSLADMARRYLDLHVSKEVRSEFGTATVMTEEMKEYAARDVELTLAVRRAQVLQGRDMHNYWNVDAPMIWVLLDIQPVKVDVEKWRTFTEENQKKAIEIQDELGFNVKSYQQVLAALTKEGIHLDSTGKKTLEKYTKNELVRKILFARKYRDVCSKYGTGWLENAVEKDNLVYANFNITGASTGRMSCVSGDTLLSINRGVFRIDEYQVQSGDEIQTHTGKWKPILRKIYKGMEPMVRVECSNGSMVQCTQNHRVLTPCGWKYVRDLHLNSEVISYVNQQSVCQQQREYRKGIESVFGGLPQTWIPNDCGRNGNEVCECVIHCPQICGRGTQECGKETSCIKGKVVLSQSDVWQEWESSSQLYWRDWGRSWICTSQEKRQVYAGTPPRYGKCAWAGEITRLAGCPSHRWEQTEQRLRQFGIGDYIGTRETTQETTTIRQLTTLGKMGVWDIEVADDHSYLAGGLIHHNSSNPNLQNIPRREFPEFRDFFIPQHDVILAPDVSQQEPRILGYLSKDENLLKALSSGESVHVYVARMIYDDPTITKDGKDPRYAIGKAINLAIGYGLTAKGLAEQTDLDEKEAQRVIDIYFKRFPGIAYYMTKYRNLAKRNEYITTVAGRRIYVNPYDFKSENNAINSPIQGGAADFTKVWAATVWRLSRERQVPFSLCMLVHDELVFDVQNEYKEQTIEIINEAMQEAAKMYPGIPFTSDLNQGNSWACHE